MDCRLRPRHLTDCPRSLPPSRGPQRPLDSAWAGEGFPACWCAAGASGASGARARAGGVQPGSWLLAPGSWLLAPGSWLLAPGSWLGGRRVSWTDALGSAVPVAGHVGSQGTKVQHARVAIRPVAPRGWGSRAGVRAARGWGVQLGAAHGRGGSVSPGGHQTPQKALCGPPSAAVGLRVPSWSARAGWRLLVGPGPAPGSCSGTLCRVRASVRRPSPPALLARLQASHDRTFRPAAGRVVRGPSRLAALMLPGGLGRSPVAPSGLRSASLPTMRRRWPSERLTSTSALRWCMVRERDRRQFVPRAATPTCRPAFRGSERSGIVPPGPG